VHYRVFPYTPHAQRFVLLSGFASPVESYKPAHSTASRRREVKLERRADLMPGSSAGIASRGEAIALEQRMANRAFARRFSRGFSLTELLISIAILGILLVISVPTLMRAYRSYQLNDAATKFSGMLKSTRFSAIRKNTPVACKVQQNGAFWTIWADLDGDGNPSATEQQVVIGDTIALLNGGSVPLPDAIVTAVGAGSPSLNVLSPGNVSVSYDQRGARKFPGAPSVDIFYLGNTSVSDTGYRAIVLLPSGSVQVWTAGPGGPWLRIS